MRTARTLTSPMCVLTKYWLKPIAEVRTVTVLAVNGARTDCPKLISISVSWPVFLTESVQEKGNTPPSHLRFDCSEMTSDVTRL